jgi:hypothetical protein
MLTSSSHVLRTVLLLYFWASALRHTCCICSISYLCNFNATGNYSTDRLRQIFSSTWSVEDVILKDSSSSSSKKKKKASALVVLSSIEAAQQAAQEVHGDMKNPLLVTPYLKVMPGAAQQQQQQQQQQGDAAAAAAAAGRGGTPPAGAAAAAAGVKQPLFASGLAGATSRQVQRPSKPLFPGECVRNMTPADGGFRMRFGSCCQFWIPLFTYL